MIEGDGSIYTPFNSNSNKVKALPHIEIAFDIKDLLLFEKIKETLGGGFITIRPNGKSGRLTIRKQSILLGLVNLINGNMKTPKIEALHRLINWFNNKNNTSIPLLGLNKTALNKSSWLAGILEADCNFYINWKLNKQNLPINLQYYLRISQKQMYTRKLDPNIKISNYDFINEISNFLNTKIKLINRNKSTYVEKAFELRTDTLQSKIILFNYLEKYPLFGYKYFSQINLLKIHNLKLKKEYKTKEGFNKLKLYFNLMKYDNNNKIYTWDHLDNFYKF